MTTIKPVDMLHVECCQWTNWIRKWQLSVAREGSKTWSIEATWRPRVASLREGAPGDVVQDPFASQLRRDEAKMHDASHDTPEKIREAPSFMHKAGWLLPLSLKVRVDGAVQ
jgi:hypothetical protein